MTPRYLHLQFAIALAILILTRSVQCAQIDIAGPQGSARFGTRAAVLPNGNIVVTDPDYSIPGGASKVGAVYLYSPLGTLISTLTGSSDNDRVGSKVTVFTSGNYVILSPDWHNAGAARAGAVTFGDPVNGVSGVVSVANSLVGSSPGDVIGSDGVTLLNSNNYVVMSPNWTNGPAVSAGAATWCNASNPTTGIVSSSNSMVGTSPKDQVGLMVYRLVNGHYVIISPSWNNGAASQAGAATWGNGFSGITGEVSIANSLVGSSPDDQVGYVNPVPLTNGNYLIVSRNWANGAATRAGAVTWCNGSTGRTGPVSPENSLVGTVAHDRIGTANGTVVALPNGNYVVTSVWWNNGAATKAGAVTWCDGTTGRVGPVSPANSLVGSHANDRLGWGGVYRLTNGNYVIASPDWANGALAQAGAATWCNGAMGLVGEISASNSLIGSSAKDQISAYFNGIEPLTNGNYLVCSPNWANGSVLEAGAVTWVNGNTGITGEINAGNSLVGTYKYDNVGSALPLTNGNYVVASNWHQLGAVTWGNGTTGVSGEISAANSLVGDPSSGDIWSSVTPLSNGNYVVSSIDWNDYLGAVTWANGTTGITGNVTAENSLIGTQTHPLRGAVVALTNGNYAMRNTVDPSGDNNTFQLATWGNGNGATLGELSDFNSIVYRDSSPIPRTLNIIPVADGNYLVDHESWVNGAGQRVGAVTLCNGNSGTTGAVDPSNSVIGTTIGGGSSFTTGYDPARKHMIVGRPGDNIVSIFFYNSFAPVVQPQVSFSVDENSEIGTVIGSILGNDPDSPVLTYLIASGNEAGAFKIDSVTGAISVFASNKLNYETAAHQYNLTVAVLDGEFEASTVVVIELLDVNEVPQVTALQPTVIGENSPNGMPLGSIIAIDEDSETTLIYSITAGDTDGAFSIDASGKVSVLDSGKLDYETVAGHKFDLAIIVSDGANEVLTTFTINLLDENEPPVLNPAGPFVLPEHSANATQVGTVSGSDPDVGALLVYSITAGNTGGAFSINSSSGVISVADSTKLDYDTVPGHEFTLTVKVADGTFEASGFITVQLLEVNSAPALASGPDAASNPAYAGDTVLLSVAAVDPDSDPLSFTWDFNDGTQPGSGASVQHAFAAVGTYTVTVTVSDGELLATGSVVIVVNAVATAAVSKGSVKFIFTVPAKDSFSLAGTLPLQNGFVIQGKPLELAIVDYVKSGLAFDARNTAADGKNISLKLTAKMNKKTGTILVPPAVKYALVLKNLDLFESMQSAGFRNDDVKNLEVPVNTILRIDGVPYASTRTFRYSAKKGKSGSGQ